jgi:X-Pro dipeptidyl-peptidase
MTLGQRDGSTTGYINSPSLSGADAVKLGDNPNRLLFLTGTTKREVRISGTPSVDLNVTHASPVGQLSVMLVDYGQMDRISVEGEGARTLQTQSCWGLSTADDDACYFDVAPRVDSTALQVLARGWIRLAGAGNHNVMLELSATDITVPAGHQLGIVISGSSDGVVALDTAATKYTLGLSSSRLNLPVAGPMSGFGPGHITAKDTLNLPPGTVSSLNEKVWPDN